MAKIVAAVPFHVDQGGELTTGSAPGFCRLIPELSELGNRTRKMHGGKETKSAIPLETAQIEIYHNQLYRGGSVLGNKVGEQEELWRRCISLFALSKYRSLNIELEVIVKMDCSDLIWGIFGRNILTSTGLYNAVCLMKCQGKIIALSDIHTVWTPIAGLRVLESIGMGETGDLEPYEKVLVLAYLNEIVNKGLDCDTYIQRFIKKLGNDGVSVNKVPNMAQVMPACRNQWEQAGKPQSVINAIFSIPAPGLSVPYPFFDTLCLTRYITRENMHSLQFKVTDDEGGVHYLTALLPLSRELIKEMELSDDIVLDEITINGDDFKKSQRLLISLTLQVMNETIIYSRVYTKKEIRYFVNMPTISVFPYVNLPDGVWKDYNLVLLRANTEKPTTDFLKQLGLETLDASRIDLAGYHTTKQIKANSNGYQWYYAKPDKLPKFVTLCETDMDDDKKRNKNKEAGYIGSIALVLPEDSERSQNVFNNNKTYNWAIDLGTSNTIAALKGDSADIHYDLIKKNIHMPLLDSRNTARLNRFFDIYAPIQARIGKYRTMGIVYERYLAGVQNHCYEHGCALFYDFKGLSDSLKENESPEDAQIITDIKFGNRTQIDAVALHIYLDNMLWLGCLNAILHGASNLNVMISYPREEVHNRIKQVWNAVQNLMLSKCNLNINLQFITEAEANYWYQKKAAFNSTGTVAVTNDFGIIDIGHGTSDMNFFFHTESQNERPKQLQVSVRYAGKEILVDTINNYFQTDADGFESIWDIQNRASQATDQYASQNDSGQQDGAFDKNELGKILIEQYKENAKKFANLAAGNVVADGGENIITLKAKQCDIIITLLQEIGLRKTISATVEPERNKNLVIFLKFKYMNLFLMYAYILRSCPQQTANNNFKLFLYGGGRHGLRTITGTNLTDMNETNLGKAIRNIIAEAAKIPMEQVEIIAKDTDKKTEVVDGMLYKQNNTDEKRKTYSKRDEVAAFLGDSNQMPASKVWNISFQEELEKVYCSFVEFYKDKKELLMNDFLLEYKEPGELYWYISISDNQCNTDEQKELVKSNQTAFQSKAQNIWDSISNDKENPSKILHLLFCCKMSEDILLEHLR